MLQMNLFRTYTIGMAMRHLSLILAFFVLGYCGRPRSMAVRSNSGYTKGVFRFKHKQASPHGPKIRVALGSWSQFTVSTSRGYIVKDRSGRVIDRGNGAPKLKKLKPGNKYLMKMQSGMFTLNKRKYRGNLVLKVGRSKITAINVLPIEAYLYGVIGSEMSASWPMEALKAQAVCARTFAWRRIQEARSKKKDYDVDASTASQVYKGLEREAPSVWQAVNQTKGQVMMKDGKLINAFFYSSCGGVTEEAHYVWGAKDHSTQTKRCPHCRQAKTFKWRTKLGRRDLNRVARKSGLGTFRKMKILKRSPSPPLYFNLLRALSVSMGDLFSKHRRKGNHVGYIFGKLVLIGAIGE
jgi:hypothetical protein